MWLEDPESESGRGLEFGLVKYVARMAARCTPFGLFAGNSVGTIARETRLELLDRGAAVRHTRLDMDYLCAVVARLASDPDVRAKLTFFANSSLYEVAGAYRYAEARLQGGRRAYFLVDVEAHDALRRAMRRAKEGESLDEIARAIVDEDVDFETARAFVDDLVEAQLLVSDLGPVVTGPESEEELLARLAPIEPARDAATILERTREALVDLDAAGLGAAPAAYRALATPLATLADAELSRLFQVDLMKPAKSVTISEDLVDELLRGVQVLLDLFTKGRPDPLASFRRAFEDRYGEREIPLVEALDEEVGLGFDAAEGPGVDPSPLLAGLPFPPTDEEEAAKVGERATFLQKKLAEALESGSEEIALDPAELSRFHIESGPRLADAFHIAATLFTPNPDDANAPRAILDSAVGPSGARLLGRFCHGDPELRAHVEEHLRAEEALRPDIVYFEIVHLPEGRIGNILARPLLRSYELAFLGTSGAARDRTLSIDDFTVRMEGGRVVLSSRTLGRDVIPRLTSAHNTAWRSLGLYRFLAALQSQGCIEGITWSWGTLERVPRLPRVRLGRLVLSRAHWNAHRDETKRLTASRGHEAFRETQAWRVRRRLPRWIGLVDSDNVLPIDLDHPLSVAAFLDELRGRDGFTVHEMFPGGRTDAVVAPEGRFLNEIVIPIVRRPPETAALAASPEGDRGAPAPVVRERRPFPQVFPPGSSWLTAKLYTGPALADRVLLDVVAPLVEEARDSGAIHRWFFLRFGDPDWHLRVRLEGDPARLASEVLPALHRAVASHVADRRVHRVQLDTYVRETLRYGGERGVVLCEELFHQDSRAALALLTRTEGDAGLDARWRFAFLGMDRLLGDFGFTIAEKLAILRELAREFAAEFRVDSNLRRPMMDRYRIERRTLDELLDGRGDAAASFAEESALLDARSQATRATFEELGALAAKGELRATRESLAASLLHMSANRVLRSSNRAQEMVLYHFLESAYASRLARAKHTTDGPS